MYTMHDLDIIACNASYGVGGLGAALAELVEQSRAGGRLDHYYAGMPKAGDSAGRDVTLAQWRPLFQMPPLRNRHAWRDFLSADLFDRLVASLLVAPTAGEMACTFIGFSGRAYHSFRRARQLGFDKLVLESGTPHIDHVWRRHCDAARRYPFDQSWICEATRRKYRQEYELADTILYQSEYTRESLIAGGVPAAKLQRRTQSVAPRFAPPQNRAATDGFVVVCIGRLQVSKGIPVLIEAFGLIDDPLAELILVGGAATSRMEHYLDACRAKDRRIKLCPGDPLPHLHRADVLAHPSYEDGLALSPLEALACGVPVIVTEDTGMKESVMPGQNGYIVPTGDVEALHRRLEDIRRCPLRDTFELVRRSGKPVVAP